MKRCFKCGEVKPLTEFYKHKQMADGYLNKCKECTKKDTSLNYQKNIDHYKKYDRARNKLPHRKTAYTKRTKRFRENNPEKYAAHLVVNNYKRYGKVRLSDKCECCGKTNIILHAHHEDYSKPLDIIWLCPACHIKTHSKKQKAI